MILMDGGISNKSKKIYEYSFKLIEEDIGKKEFRKVKNSMYFKHKEGLYVFTPPVMAESRIIDYVGTFVTFSFLYQRHEDNQFITKRIDIYDFFKELIIHILEQNFITVRYYRIYSKKHKFHDKMVMLFQSPIIKFRNSLISW